jgi:hypothetical protein
MVLGERFGRLVVIALLPNRRVQCQCDCGTVSEHLRGNVTRGNARSCGCFRREKTLIHGVGDWPEHHAWKNMIARCHNKRCATYPRYGGRGITVCPVWRNDFFSFVAHIGRRPSSKHSIDRIDTLRGYEPGNVRWATVAEQAANRRSARLITAFCATRSLKDWSCITGIPPSTIGRRLAKRGMMPEEALTAARYVRHP